MRSFGRTRHFFTEFRKQLGNDVIAGEAFAILGLEELLANDPFGVDEEISGARHSLELAGRFGVQDLVGANGLGIGIAQQRKVDLPAVGEIFQNFRAVVADCRQLDPLLLKPGLGVLQLDQLPFAVGSPIGRTEKQKNGAVRAFQRFECLLRAELVGGGKSGRLLAHGESDAGEHFDRGNANRIAVERALDRYTVSQAAGGLVLRIEVEHQPESVVIQR